MSRNVNKKWRNRTRTRPLARQRPFDITMCSKETFGAGEPIFTYASGAVEDDFRSMENSTFTAGVSLTRLLLKNLGPLSHPNLIEDTLKKTARLVGFCYTDSTGRKPSTTSTSPSSDWTHVPVTIAGNMTTSTATLTSILSGEWNATMKAHIKWVDIVASANGDATASPTGLHAGSMILVGEKVLRLIDPYKKGDRRSVTFILSTVSD